MKTVKTSLIAALIVPSFALGMIAMPASAAFEPIPVYDHHEKDDEKKAKKKAKYAAHMAKMKEECAKTDDAEKCMADKKAKMKAKHAEMKKHKKDGEPKKEGEH